GAGHIHGLLRTDVPEATDVVTVDPDHAFAEVAHVEEGVVSLGDLEGAAPEGRAGLGVHRAGLEAEGGEVLGVEFERMDLPVADLARIGAAGGEAHGTVDALAVEDLATEVHAAHGLDDDLETRVGCACGDGQLVAAGAAVEGAER